jgi:enamine deaminase RidA (YjgF/YER057c/UK114 family)
MRALSSFICVPALTERQTKMIQRHNVGKRLSEIVVHNGVAYLAGEVPDDGTKDITGQTEEVLAKIDKLLKQVGSDKTKLLSAQIFLPDMKDFAGMNARGRMGRRGADAGARHHRGEAREPGLQGRDHVHRGAVMPR